MDSWHGRGFRDGLRLAFIAWSLAVAGHPQASQTLPFMLPWNDATQGATDMSSLNTPIGPDSRVSVDAAGHFVAAGSRVRFLGVNLAGDSPFVPTNNAEGIAARLAKFGVNAVRLHHMDASWAYNGGILAYTTSSSTNVNAAQLERVHYLVSRLKAHGIYSDVNLLVGREYRSGDGLGAEVVGMDWKDAHTLAFFMPAALRLHQDYATKLLAATNRFTGFPLAKDPAVAFVEILNENGILQKWVDGGVDRLPDRYSLMLRDRWNTWLKARYPSETAMLAAWGVINEALGKNMLANGAFSNGLTGWVTEQHNNTRAASTRTYEFTGGAPSARVVVSVKDTVGWYAQFNSAGLKLTTNQAYTLSFWAKCNMATNADVSVMQAHGDYANLGLSMPLSLNTNWQQFTASFQATATDSNARVNFGSMGDKVATFWFADVRLQPGGQVGMLPDGASLAAGTVPNLKYSGVGSGYTGTKAARRDWLRFLRDLENEYYSAMLAHLRSSAIGYQGLAFGTIMANSPATVQSRLDVVDGHAYWQHPQFPGTPWDSLNWYQPNISMVNTIGDDNTLAGLARQRIQGKPFTVTEYQHPSPNYYGSEGPLLLAAYAAFQDWDGLWLFDYGPGSPTVPMGYVRGYFEIGQHPTKMANLAMAANIFRRGDVAASAKEVAMALTPERELDYLQNASAWSLFSSGQAGLSGKLAFTSRINTSVGENPTGLTAPPAAPTGNVLASDTGELKWDLSQSSKGLVSFNTPRSKALVGFADGRAVSLGEVAFTPGPTQLGWCTLGATLMRGTSFTNNCTALVVASGWWENTGQTWTDTNHESVGNKWGRAPVLVEVVPFSMTVPVGTNHVKIWALDERGQRRGQMPISGDAGSTTLTVTTNTAGSIWYEMEVERWTTSFNEWRQRYFAPEEIANPAVSGDNAAPDSDRMPNLLKYYLGLPRLAGSAFEALPKPSLVQDGNGMHLALSWSQDRLVEDVDWTVQVSPDLSQWFSGPSWTSLYASNENASQRSFVVRDQAAIGDGNSGSRARFMRLRLQRRIP